MFLVAELQDPFVVPKAFQREGAILFALFFSSKKEHWDYFEEGERHSLVSFPSPFGSPVKELAISRNE